MRFHFIDALKGFGIILVVYAHHSLPDALETYIYSFHMPLFFFISGFLFDFEKYAESTENFVKKRFNSLIVPYFFFALLAYLIYFLLQKVAPDIFKFGNFYDYIHAILYASGIDIIYLINPPLWFLPCLFVTELLFYGFTRMCNGEFRKLVFWIIASGVIGYLYFLYVSFRLPWSVDVALSAVVFYGAGNLFKKFTDSLAEAESGIGLDADSKINNIYSHVERFFLGVLILLSLLYIGYLIENSPADTIDMSSMRYVNFFDFYPLAFLGIFTFVSLFRKIGGSRILEYYGRNSLIVVVLHYPIMYILITLIFVIFGVDLNVDKCDVILGLVLSVVNLILLVPVIYIIINYFSFTIGKGSSKSFEGTKRIEGRL